MPGPSDWVTPLRTGVSRKSIPAHFIPAALATTIGILCWAPFVMATSWRPPVRPLTTEEKIDFAVSQSRLIGVGVAEAIHDSLDRDGSRWSWLESSRSGG